jgi:hypothetical protein
MAYILLFSKWLLPGDDAADDLNSALYVTSGSRAAGKTARASGLWGGASKCVRVCVRACVCVHALAGAA